jgi:hypothetical protein
MKLRPIISASLALGAAHSFAAGLAESERKPTINRVTPEFREKVARATDEVKKNNGGMRAPETPLPKTEELNLDYTRSDATAVCFGSIGPWIPWDGDGDTRKLDAPSHQPFVRTWTCESRDSVVKALGFAGFFLKGSGYVCSFTPLPQAQIAAKAFDVASFASTSIGLIVSVTTCENTLETKFDALLKACENLRTMGADCQGVDNTPF